MNAVRHGLLARCVVLDNESRDCFDQVVTQYLDCFRPANDVELGMIEEMIAAAWRQRRAWAIETSLMDTAISRQPAGDELIRIAAAYTSLSQQPQSALISRYEARLHRMFRNALNNLLLVRTIARPNERDETPRTDSELPNEPDIRPIDPPEALRSVELPNEPGVRPIDPPNTLRSTERPNEPGIRLINTLGILTIDLPNEPFLSS